MPSTRATASARQRPADDLLRLADDALQPLLAVEALRVDLVDVLGAGRPRREPAVLRDDLEPADRRAVAGRLGQHGLDRLAGELVALHLLGREPLEHVLLLRARGDVGALVRGAAEALGQAGVDLARVLAGRRLHL